MIALPADTVMVMLCKIKRFNAAPFLLGVIVSSSYVWARIRISALISGEGLRSITARSSPK